MVELPRAEHPDRGAPNATFGTLVLELLERRGLSQSAFAKLLDVHVQAINPIIAGRRAMPQRQVTRWADLLGLKGAERHEFIIEAALSASPPIIRDEFAKLRRVARSDRSGRQA